MTTVIEPKKKKVMKATVQTLQEEYDKANRKGLETFTVETYEFYTPYAKYLLQYLESIKMPRTKLLSSFLVKK